MHEEILIRWINPVRLGQGAFARVYRMEDKVTGELAACKISQNQQLTEREGRMLEVLKHPLFPEYRGSCIHKGCYYLFMEYICGGDLRQYVERRGGLSRARAIQIAYTLGSGLLYLHERSTPVIYRDIKPENVMIQFDGGIRLVDLGCIGMVGQAGNGLAGSPWYAAPEQLIPNYQVNVECDVYGLGKLLCFMLLGREQREVPQGDALSQFLARATAANPKERIPDMRIFLQELEYYGEGNCIKRLRMKQKRRCYQKGKQDFYYFQNIRR